MTYTQEDFERDLYSITPTSIDDEDWLYNTATTDRIIAAYRDLQAENERLRGDFHTQTDNAYEWKARAEAAEAENERLREIIGDLTERINVLGNMVAGHKERIAHEVERYKKASSDRDHWKARAEVAERVCEAARELEQTFSDYEAYDEGATYTVDYRLAIDLSAALAAWEATRITTPCLDSCSERDRCVERDKAECEWCQNPAVVKDAQRYDPTTTPRG